MERRQEQVRLHECGEANGELPGLWWPDTVLADAATYFAKQDVITDVHELEHFMQDHSDQVLVDLYVNGGTIADFKKFGLCSIDRCAALSVADGSRRTSV